MILTGLSLFKDLWSNLNIEEKLKIKEFIILENLKDDLKTVSIAKKKAKKYGIIM
jgi:hypothetical protein